MMLLIHLIQTTCTILKKDDNFLTGPIPSELGNLIHLTYLTFGTFVCLLLLLIVIDTMCTCIV